MSAFLDELAEWVASAQRRRKESLVAFLAVRSDIEEAMRAGYALKTVWAHLRETGRIACVTKLSAPMSGDTSSSNALASEMHLLASN